MKIQSFDVFAPFYDLFAAVFRRRIPGKILSCLKPGDGDILLDIGGGTGYNSARMEGAGRRLIVLDISFEMLKRAKKYRHLDLVQGDARMLPFKGKSLDIILAVDSLHHVRDYPGVLKEVRRTGKERFFAAEFFGRNLAGRMLTGIERFFFPVDYKSPDEFCLEASRQGIPGNYDYISVFEYFFLGQIQAIHKKDQSGTGPSREDRDDS